MNYLLLLLLNLLIPIYSTDVVFLIDSSTSIFDNDECSHQNLIRNFTSNLVRELIDCDVNYASFQYNIRAYNDYSFSNNNTYVYEKMKYYTYKYGAPTVISYGLDKIIKLYKLENRSEPIYLILLTDGETLNKNDLHKALDVYPFNSSDLNNVVIKIGTHNPDNQFVLDEFSNNTHYNILSCSKDPLIYILNNYNLCGLTTTANTISTTTANTISKTTANTISTTTSNTISTTTSNTISTTTSNTISTTTANTISKTTANTISTTTANTNNTNTIVDNSLNKVYRIIIIIISSCIIIFPCGALMYICVNKTNNRITDIIQEEPVNDFYHYNNQPRIIHNSIYDTTSMNDVGYVEVDGEDEEQSSFDATLFQTQYNYYKNNKSMTTDF